MITNLLIYFILIFVNAVGATEMKSSKQEIQILLETFQDSEGAAIKKIEKKDKDHYWVDVVTNLKKCHRYKIKIQNKSAKVMPEVFSCD